MSMNSVCATWRFRPRMPRWPIRGRVGRCSSPGPTGKSGNARRLNLEPPVARVGVNAYWIFDYRMSGIAAVYYRDGRPADRGLIGAMLDAAAWRGPDGLNAWVDGPVALGHAMLRTTPEAA